MGKGEQYESHPRQGWSGTKRGSSEDSGASVRHMRLRLIRESSKRLLKKPVWSLKSVRRLKSISFSPGR